MAVNLYSIIYSPDQTPDFTPYDNSHIKTVEQRSYLFEYNPILDLSKSFEPDQYYGIFSWKFRQKTGFNPHILKFMLDWHRYKEFDLITICRPLPYPYLFFTEVNHPGFMDLFAQVCGKLNITIKEPTTTIYSNQFIAKGSLYSEYVDSVLKPAIELLDGQYKDLAFNNSGYKGLNAAKLKEVTGLNYYTFHTFILERLLSVWIENKDLKILNLIK